MKTLQLASLFAFLSSTILLAGCGPDWIWSPAPPAKTDLFGTISIIDSSGKPIPGDWSGISITVMDEYRGNTIATATTDHDGKWQLAQSPIGYIAVVATEPGYSRYYLGTYLNGQEAEASGSISPAMKHSVTIDSVVGHYFDGSLEVFGHDQSGSGGNVLCCIDTTRGIPSNGPHLSYATGYFGQSLRHEPGGLCEVPFDARLTAADTVYVTAYSINSFEEHYFEPYSYVAALGVPYASCGPRSNVVAVER